MKIKPILFSTPMVQAILDGRKTQTRREIFKNNPSLNAPGIICTGFTDNNKIAHFQHKDSFVSAAGENPKYQVGDILWVRETFRYAHHYGFDYEFVQYKDGSTNTHCQIPDKDQILHDDKWKPSIFMPKEACRLFLEVTDVRVERLQNISEEDAKAEGIEINPDYWGSDGALNYMYGEEASYKREYFFAEHPYSFSGIKNHNGIKASFYSLWARVNSWNSVVNNPWVWVYEFKRVERPENF